MATQEINIDRTTQAAEGVVVEQAEVREAAERVTALTEEIGRMREVLRAVGGGEPLAYIPPDAGQYYGRVLEREAEIQQLQERYGSQTLEAAALVSEGPRVEESQSHKIADALSTQGLYEFAKTQQFYFQSETTKKIEFGLMLEGEDMLTLTLHRANISAPVDGARLGLEHGEEVFISAKEAMQLLSPQAVREWNENELDLGEDLSLEPEQKITQVLDVAEMFAQVASAPGTAFGVPEKLLAGYIDEQLRAGSQHINLTQTYLTEDPSVADARHTLALHQLLPLIENAQNSGVTFDSGQAQLASEKFREVIAIRPSREEESKFSVTA